MNIRTVFLDPDGKLRSGWRFAVFAFGMIIAVGMLSAVEDMIFPGLADTSLGIAPSALVTNSLIMLIPALLIGWLCGRYLEQLPFAALGATIHRRWFVNFLAGLVIGAVTLLIAVGLAMIFGGTRFDPNEFAAADISRSLAVSAGVFLIGAAAEEALFRGYILQTFARSGLAWFAIALTSLFFGALHLRNPDANLLSTVNTVLAGIWFGLAYLKTRDLWFVTGLHFVWNWLQGSVFGIEVSGLTRLVTHPVLREVENGPAWIGGGTYGLEGGIVTTVAIILSIIAIYYLPFPKPD